VESSGLQPRFLSHAVLPALREQEGVSSSAQETQTPLSPDLQTCISQWHFHWLLI
jgi:hypothetical protein